MAFPATCDDSPVITATPSEQEPRTGIGFRRQVKESPIVHDVWATTDDWADAPKLALSFHIHEPAAEGVTNFSTQNQQRIWEIAESSEAVLGGDATE